MRFIISTVLIAVISTPINTAYGKEDSEYVSLQAQSCKVPDDLVIRHYLSRNLVVSECPTRAIVQSAPLKLFIVSTDERSWIDLAIGNTIWSSEDEVVYEKENQFGYFPNVGNAPAEIRMSDTGVVAGLIFRVTAQAPDARSANLGTSNVSRLFVIGLKKSGACFLGLASNNTMARKLLDSGAVCKRMLKTEQLP